MALYQNGILISGANQLPQMTLAEWQALPSAERPTYWICTDREYSDLPASDVTYDNTDSGLSATTVQDAIDEVAQGGGGGGSYSAGDGIDITNNEISVDTAFTEASTRANIASGDTLSTIWGKIKKFFSDLKTHAFTALDQNSIDIGGLAGGQQYVYAKGLNDFSYNNGVIQVSKRTGYSSYDTALIPIPTKTSELSNDSSFISGTVSTSNVGNTIVKRTSEGYIYGNYVNLNIAGENIYSYTPMFPFFDSNGWLRKSSSNTYYAEKLLKLQYVTGAGVASTNIGWGIFPYLAEINITTPSTFSYCMLMGVYGDSGASSGFIVSGIYPNGSAKTIKLFVYSSAYVTVRASFLCML